MKRFLKLFVVAFSPALLVAQVEKPLVVVIPSYNNAKYYQKNLESVRTQNYDNYRVIYVNDASTDRTGELVAQYVEEHDLVDRFTYVENEQNKRALHNLYYAIHSCDDEEIILTLDGDDWFSHDNVFKKINEAYQNQDVWLTYGQYQQYPNGRRGVCRAFPDNVIAKNNFRGYSWISSQLRTFYAKLFKSIKLEDLMHQGKFFPAAYDVAMMFPMLEMAGKHIRFIDEVLYIYNRQNPISDSRVHRKEQSLGRGMRKMSRYRPLEQLLD